MSKLEFYRQSYASNLITNRVLHQIGVIQDYLNQSTYGVSCSNYNHGFEGTLKLRDVAFKVVKLIKHEMNFPETESAAEGEEFIKELKERNERRMEAQCKLLDHFINLQRLKNEKEIEQECKCNKKHKEEN